MDVDAIVSALRGALPDVLIALDFDGTLAPIVPDPEHSRPEPGTLEALAGLAARGAQIAIVTGRDARTVLRLGGFESIPGIVVAGLYGAETWTGGALTTPDTPAAITTLRQRLPETLAGAGADPDVWIEDKRLSLVVHGRLAADPEAALAPLRGPVEQLADELDLGYHPGKGVLELRLPGYDKAGALQALTAARGYGAVLFAGDDLGDVPALEQIARLRADGRVAFGVAVSAGGVAEAAAAADLVVDEPADVVRLLAAI